MSKEVLIRLGLILAAVLFFSYNAGDIGRQFTGDENFYFESCKGMVESGDWLTPRYFGEPRFQKPILYYWFVASSLALSNGGWFAARLPSILFGAFTVFLVYLMALELFKKRGISLLSALILATTFKFFKYTRFAIPDMALLFFVTLSFYLIMKLLKGEKGRVLTGGLVAVLAFGTLIKGPIAVIIPALSFLIFVMFSKESVYLNRRDLFIGVSLYLAIVLPWFIIMYSKHGSLFVSHLWTREVAGRVGHYSESKGLLLIISEYARGIFFYIPIIFVRFLPWSIFLPFGVAYGLSKKRAKGFQKNHFILALSWFLAVFIFFSLMGEKHSQYMLALTPPFALLCGVAFLSDSQRGKKGLGMPVALLLITTLGFVSFLSQDDPKLNSVVMSRFSSEIIKHGLDKDDKIAIGSHDLIPQHLEAYLGRPVEKAAGKWGDPEYHERTNKLKLANFFKYNSGTYCLIKKADYEDFVAPIDKGRLKIIYQDKFWRRKLGLTKESLALFLKRGMNVFLESIQDEYYLVTDK